MTKTDVIKGFLESGNFTRTVIAKYFQISYEEVKRIESTLHTQDELSEENKSNTDEVCYYEYLENEFNAKNDIYKHPCESYDLETDIRYIQGVEASTMNIIKAGLESGLSMEKLSYILEISVKEIEEIMEEMETDAVSAYN